MMNETILLQGFNAEEEIRKSCNLIKETARAMNYYNALVPVSGGIDSAVVLYLAKLAVDELAKEENIDTTATALYMPTEVTSQETRNIMQEFQNEIREKGAEYVEIPLDNILNQCPGYEESLETAKEFIIGKPPYEDPSGKSGLRRFLSGEYKGSMDVMLYLFLSCTFRTALAYAEAERRDAIFVAAPNRTEIETGLTNRGSPDTAGDCWPISNYYKTQVYELARALNVPIPIRDRVPSPDLGISKDEKNLGAPYPIVDLVLYGKNRLDLNVDELTQELERADIFSKYEDGIDTLELTCKNHKQLVQNILVTNELSKPLRKVPYRK